MTRKIATTLNLLLVIISGCFFGYTFFAKDHLINHTRQFVFDKTLEYSIPIVTSTKEIINDPLLGNALPANVKNDIISEIDAFEENPSDYVLRITSEEKPDFGEGKVADFKNKIHHHYQSILDGLLRDLRIFSGSNLVFGLISLLLLIVSNKNNNTIVVLSIIIFLVVAWSTYNYIDGISFISILLNSHAGWVYPLGIAVSIYKLCIDNPFLENQSKSNQQPS